MTKGVAIEQIYLNVTGGKPSDDINVMRVDIEPYLAASIHSHLGMDVKDQERLAVRKRAGDAMMVREGFYGTYKIKPEKIRGLKSVVLPPFVRLP